MKKKLSLSALTCAGAIITLGRGANTQSNEDGDEALDKSLDDYAAKCATKAAALLAADPADVADAIERLTANGEVGLIADAMLTLARVATVGAAMLKPGEFGTA